MTIETVHVLLVDDDEDDFIMTRDFLSEAEQIKFKLTWVDNYDKGLLAIHQNHHDVYLLDFRLGKRNGLELLQEALQSGCSKPIILLTGVGDREIDSQAMVAGASDYLVKGSTLSALLLERSILHAIERKRVEIRQAQLVEELGAVNKELKDFAYIVSHDLKAPLRGIVSIANWLQEDYAPFFDNEGRQMLQLLGGRARRMSDLIDGILEYSRAGRLPEGKSLINLNDLVVDILDGLAPPRGIRLSVETQLPTLWIGKNQIAQVFQNLISNSIKYMGKPEGEIRVGHSIVNHEWQFYVADSGIGIEERFFDKIFQIFQTLAPRDQIESTGVGLAIVKKIVDAYGGKVWVTSTIRQGSTFWFTLPLSITKDEGSLP